jgi:hypothetical protein
VAIINKQIYQNNKIFISGFNSKQNIHFEETKEKNKLIDEKEQERLLEEEEQKASCLIFPSTNKPKMAWDMYVVVLLLYTAFFVPYKVCFVDTSTRFDFILDCFIDASFCTDIILTFFTAVDDGKGNVITNKKDIACRYLSGWFAIDIITTIPF